MGESSTESWEAGCPDAETLAAFIDGAERDDQLARLSRHLVECERCYETVAATVRFLSRERASDRAPAWALLPAMLTAVGMAIVLTFCLFLLLSGT